MIPAMKDITRVVLLGKTGSGKSSLINTIIGNDKCLVNDTPNSETTKCQPIMETVNKRRMLFVDTPGVFDTNPKDTEATSAILQCITECAPGPHAFLLLLKIEKYTVLEEAVVNIILKYFTEEALKYTTVVFTRGDDLSEKMKIEEWVKLNKSLDELVQKCGGRCHVFDNKYWNGQNDREYRNNQYQVRELLETIDKTLAENGGQHYTNDVLKTLGEEIVKEMERIATTVSGNMPQGEIYKRAKQNIFERLCSYMKATPVGVILGALLGVAALVPLVLSGIPCSISGVAVGVVAIGVGAALGSGIEYAIRKYKKPANPTQDDLKEPLVEQDMEEKEVPEDVEAILTKGKEKFNEIVGLYQSSLCQSAKSSMTP